MFPSALNLADFFVTLISGDPPAPRAMLRSRTFEAFHTRKVWSCRESNSRIPHAQKRTICQPSYSHRACLNSVPPCRTERNGTRLVRSVPLVKKRVDVHNLGSRQPNQYGDNLLHMPRHKKQGCWCAISVCLNLRQWVMSSHSDKILCLFGRAVRSSWRRRGPTSNTCHVLPLPTHKKLFSSGCMESVRCRQPISTKLIWQIQFLSVRSSATWRG